VERLEKKKLHATEKPRPRRVCAEDHIPAEVRRTVWERDRGQCTFTSEDGVRCAATQDLQNDHIVPKARGGRSDDPGNIRLRCHAHNQYEAERAFGKAFMEQKREQARAAAAKRRAEKEAEREEARAAAVARRKAERLAAKAAKEAADKAAREASEDAELVEWLQMFGYSVAQAESMMAVVRRWEGRSPESRRMECLLRLREREKLASTGT
jgi:5-methylcytosine-specific restriction endonuclease McrA